MPITAYFQIFLNEAGVTEIGTIEIMYIKKVVVFNK